MDTDQATELAQTFGLLADPTRVSIVMACMDAEKSVGDIAAKLSLSTSLTSHHLRLLRSARILKTERRGKQVFYSMSDACVPKVLTIMIEHLFTHEHQDAD
ncbi:MAG: metalloregulator ArsR/SmtB family transcription factor [Pseudomonadota bacterium]